MLTAHEPFYRTGGDFSFNYRTFNLFGLYMYGHDKDLELNPATGQASCRRSSAHFNGGFLEADYLALPWLMTIMRYDRVQSQADLLLAQNGGQGSYFSPASATRNRFSPGVQFLIHANIKASFEYQWRPEQRIYDGEGNPLSQSFPHQSGDRRIGVGVLDEIRNSNQDALYQGEIMKGKVAAILAVMMALSVAASAGSISGKVSGVNGESVVYVDTIAGKTFPAPSEHPVIDQKGLLFQPHINVVLVGTTVDFLNSDKVAHNVFWPSVMQGRQEAAG